MQSTEQKLREALQALLEESIHESMAPANARSALALPTAAPVGERERFEKWAREQFYSGLACPSDTWSDERNTYNDAAHHMAFCAFRAALSAGDAVDAQRYRWLREQSDGDFAFAVVKNPHFDVYESPEELDFAIDAAMRKGQL